MGCPIFFGESVLKGTTWADFNIEACQRVGFNALSSLGVYLPFPCWQDRLKKIHNFKLFTLPSKINNLDLKMTQLESGASGCQAEVFLGEPVYPFTMRSIFHSVYDSVLLAVPRR
jgi:hypothetical protein